MNTKRFARRMAAMTALLGMSSTHVQGYELSNKLYRTQTRYFQSYSEFRAAVGAASASLLPFNPVGKPEQFTQWPAQEQALLGLMASSKSYSLTIEFSDPSRRTPCAPSRELQFFKITELRNIDPGQKNTHSFRVLLQEMLGYTDSGDCQVKRTTWVQFFTDP